MDRMDSLILTEDEQNLWNIREKEPIIIASYAQTHKRNYVGATFDKKNWIITTLIAMVINLVQNLL